MTAIAWKTPGTSGKWNDANNWNPAQIPTASDTVTIGAAQNTSYTVTIPIGYAAAASTVTITGGTGSHPSNLVLAGGSLTTGGAITLFNDNSTISGYGAINAGGGFVVTSGNPSITASGGVLDITGVISAAVSVSIDAATSSTLKIETNNSFSAFSITSANQTLAIGPFANVTISGQQTVYGGKIVLAGGTITDTFGIRLGDAVITAGAISGYGKVAANVTDRGAGTNTITATGGALEVTGNVGVSGTPLASLTIGAGASDKLLLDGTSYATGVTFAGAAGTLEVNSAGSLTLTNQLVVGANTVKLDGVAGTVQLTDNNGITIAGGSITGTGTIAAATNISGFGTVGISMSTAGTITATGNGAGGTTLDLTGAVTGRTLAISTANASDLKISGTATSGAITINNANQTLEIGSVGALTITAAQTVSLGKIQLDGGTLTDSAGITLGNLANNGAISGSGKVSANLTHGGTGTASSVTASGGALEINGTVTAINSLVVGSGATDKLLLDGVSSATSATFSGSTGTLEVNTAGSLTLTNALAIGANTVKLDGGALTDAAGLTLASGGKLIGSGTVTAGSLTGAGILEASGGVLTFNGPVDGSGTASQLEIAAGSTLNLAGNIGVGTTITPTLTFLSSATSIFKATAVTQANVHLGTITGFSGTDQIQLKNSGGAGDKIVVNGNTITITTSGGTPLQSYTFAVGTAMGQISITDNTGTGVDTLTICFLAGTMIRTPDGEVPIETLKAGDLVLTTDGVAKPVSWLGKQTVVRVFADPLRSWPICVKSNALDENIPSRDLLVSPDHALLVEGALIQAGALVNGSSIVRVSEVPGIFVYYHVELDDHSLIFAENTPAETFVDTVDRMNFDNWAEHEALYPDGKAVEELPYPRAKAQRQVPVHVRVKLAERAQLIGATEAAVA